MDPMTLYKVGCNKLTPIVLPMSGPACHPTATAALSLVQYHMQTGSLPMATSLAMPQGLPYQSLGVMPMQAASIPTPVLMCPIQNHTDPGFGSLKIIGYQVQYSHPGTSIAESPCPDSSIRNTVNQPLFYQQQFMPEGPVSNLKCLTQASKNCRHISKKHDMDFKAKKLKVARLKSGSFKTVPSTQNSMSFNKQRSSNEAKEIEQKSNYHKLALDKNKPLSGKRRSKESNQKQDQKFMPQSHFSRDTTHSSWLLPSLQSSAFLTPRNNVTGKKSETNLYENELQNEFVKYISRNSNQHSYPQHVLEYHESENQNDTNQAKNESFISGTEQELQQYSAMDIDRRSFQNNRKNSSQRYHSKKVVNADNKNPSLRMEAVTSISSSFQLKLRAFENEYQKYNAELLSSKSSITSEIETFEKSVKIEDGDKEEEASNNAYVESQNELVDSETDESSPNLNKSPQMPFDMFFLTSSNRNDTSAKETNNSKKGNEEVLARNSTKITFEGLDSLECTKFKTCVCPTKKLSQSNRNKHSSLEMWKPTTSKNAQIENFQSQSIMLDKNEQPTELLQDVTETVDDTKEKQESSNMDTACLTLKRLCKFKKLCCCPLCKCVCLCSPTDPNDLCPLLACCGLRIDCDANFEKDGSTPKNDNSINQNETNGSIDNTFLQGVFDENADNNGRKSNSGLPKLTNKNKNAVLKANGTKDEENNQTGKKRTPALHSKGKKVFNNAPLITAQKKVKKYCGQQYVPYNVCNEQCHDPHINCCQYASCSKQFRGCC